MTLEERFWKKVHKTDSCWNWAGAMFLNGYGQFRNKKNKNAGAHWFSWKLHHGEPAAGLWVLHRCDNRRCVNPAHLFLGTQQDNMDDMKNKKRHCFGERQHNSKLKESDVVTMRGLIQEGRSQEEMAKRYGIAQSTVSKICLGVRWQHLGLKALDLSSRHARGEKSHCAKLTPEQVIRIRQMRKSGQSYGEIAGEFGVTSMTARHICIRQTWKHLP